MALSNHLDFSNEIRRRLHLILCLKIGFISSSSPFGRLQLIESEGDQNKAQVTRREQLHRIDTDLRSHTVSISYLS